jgi:orotidine-5'-phosphate decarboxylase
MVVDLREKIIVALDVPTAESARKLFELLRDSSVGFKIGNQLFTSAGPDIVREIKSKSRKVFLDLKYHDIPNTVARAAESATELGVDIFNIHISGGVEMMRAAAEATRIKALDLGIKKPVLLGVTILTSIDEYALRRVLNSGNSLRDQIVHMARLAQQSGLDGVVASPQEISPIRDACGDNFVILTPGVRPRWTSSDDQKRTMTPAEALKAGADYLVMGRPIYHSHDPVNALERIFHEIQEESS